MADITMEAEYGGYKIVWRDGNRGFSLFRDGVEVTEGITLVEACQAWIDDKNKQKYKCVPILLRFGWRDPRVPGEATSVIDDEYVWTVSGKDRAKMRAEECWLDTPENRQILDTINGLEAQIAQIDSEINALEASTARLTADMMIVEG